jgi:hypothetical protein
MRSAPRHRVSIRIDEPTFRLVFEQITAGTLPTAREVAAIVQLAEMVAGADLDENPEERDLLETLIRYLAQLTGISRRSIPRLGRLPGDPEERRPLCSALAGRLSSKESRELAFAFSYLLVVTDLELAPVELEALDDVQQSLEIDDNRASELAITVAELVTPGTERSRERAAHEDARR